MAALVSTAGSSAFDLGFLPCSSESRARDLVLASWERTPIRVARALPGRLEPATVDGRHLVTIAALRWAGGRLGILPVPRFSQINVRLYARHGDETAVVFVGIRVTTLGMGGALLGMPVRLSRARVREGTVEARGLGISLRYERRGPASPASWAPTSSGCTRPLGSAASASAAGRRAWGAGRSDRAARADPLLALGFAVEGGLRPSSRYVAGTTSRSELPPRRLVP